MSDKNRDPSQIPIDPAAVTAALVIIGLTITWFLLERNFESLIALIAAFSGVFTYISIKSRRVNWLLAGVVVIVALGGLYLVRDTVTQTPISKVTITKVSYEGIGKKEPDEFVEIRNEETTPINMRGWSLSDRSNNDFLFPDFTMNPGSVCRVYTNQDHPEWCGFNIKAEAAIWDNSGDCAALRDGENRLVDEYCYP